MKFLTTIAFALLINISSCTSPEKSSNQTAQEKGLKETIQEKSLKDTVYILFNPTENGQSVERRRYKDMEHADIYRYNVINEDGRISKYPFATVDVDKFEVKSADFVKQNAITIKQAFKIKGFGFYTSDSKFPFKHVFIAEPLSSGEYKITKVQTYLGSDY